MIFLTDGAPTAGELVPDKILEQVKKANTSGTRIFVMGVGNDVNAHLLDKLAELDGRFQRVRRSPGKNSTPRSPPCTTGSPTRCSPTSRWRSANWPRNRSCRRNAGPVQGKRDHDGGPVSGRRQTHLLDFRNVASTSRSHTRVPSICRAGRPTPPTNSWRRSGQHARSATCSRKSACTAKTRN